LGRIVGRRERELVRQRVWDQISFIFRWNHGFGNRRSWCRCGRNGCGCENCARSSCLDGDGRGLRNAEEIVAVKGGFCSGGCECFCRWIDTTESGAGVRPSDRNIVKPKIWKLFDIVTGEIKLQSLSRPWGSQDYLLLVEHASREGRVNIVVNIQVIHLDSGKSNA